MLKFSDNQRSVTASKMMRGMKSIVFAMSCLFVIGCSSSPEPPPTEVDGMVVSEGEDDMEREFSDEEVALFAETWVEVTAIQQQYETQMQEAEPAERDELVEESTMRSEEVIVEKGMTPQEYNAIAVRMPNDDELRQRVRTAIQQRDAQRVEETERQLQEEEDLQEDQDVEMQ